MAVRAKLLIDDKEFNILLFNFSLNQGADVTGRPTQKPIFKTISITLEAQKDANFYEWMMSHNLAKDFQIHIIPNIMGSRIRKIKFYDAHLVNLKDNFSATSNEPLSETLTITAAGVEDSTSAGIYTATWRETFPEEETEATTIDESSELVRYYITDIEGNETDEYDVSDTIILNIETKNAIGESLTISIPDKEHDFKLNGIKLINDTLRDHVISNDLEQVELEVIEEETEV